MVVMRAIPASWRAAGHLAEERQHLDLHGQVPLSFWMGCRRYDALHLPSIDAMLFGEEPLRYGPAWPIQTGDVIGKNRLFHGAYRFGANLLL